MKKILLSFFATSISILGFSQISVTGISPASIAGNYNFEIGETANSWAPALNYALPGNYVQGELVLVNDGSSGTNAQGHPVSAEGCSALTNGSAVSGKIAVVYRNTCDFGLKALNAQNAGAIGVIIINRDPELLGILGGPSGANVTIPTVMITSVDGLAITNEMQNGPVVMLIGNKAGIYANDLVLSENFVLVPRYHGVHSLLSQNASEFNFETGLRVYNYGTTAQTNAEANAKITDPSGTVIYDETLTFSLAALSGTSIDSVDLFPGDAQSFPQFSSSSYPTGEYTLEYSIKSAAGPDDSPNDNTYSVKFVVNNSYISRSRLDPVTLKPIFESHVSPAEPSETQPLTQVRYCIYFRDQNASRLSALGLVLSAAIDTASAPTLYGKSIYLDFYEWNDAFNVVSDPLFGYTSLNSAVNIEYVFENEVEQEEIYIALDEPLQLIDDQKYLVCVTNYAEKIRFGYDRSVDFNATRNIYDELPNPMFVLPNSNSSPWYGGGFGPDLTPAFAIHAVDQATASILKNEKLEGKVYPNPTNGVVKMNIPMNGKATVSVTDLSGRAVSTQEVNFLNNESTIDIKELNNGMYVINVAYENGAKSTFNVIKH